MLSMAHLRVPPSGSWSRGVLLMSLASTAGDVFWVEPPLVFLSPLPPPQAVAARASAMRRARTLRRAGISGSSNSDQRPDGRLGPSLGTGAPRTRGRSRQMPRLPRSDDRLGLGVVAGGGGGAALGGGGGVLVGGAPGLLRREGGEEGAAGGGSGGR